MSAYRLIVSGEVQGVFYRASAKDVAEKLGITGWVKNDLNGKVEAFIQGAEEQTQKFIEWCRKGPKGASVTSIEITDADEENTRGFRIIH